MSPVVTSSEGANGVVEEDTVGLLDSSDVVVAQVDKGQQPDGYVALGRSLEEDVARHVVVVAEREEERDSLVMQIQREVRERKVAPTAEPQV